MTFVQLALAFIAGALITTAIAWARLRAAASRRQLAEGLFATTARENETLRLMADRASARLTSVLAAYPRPVLILNHDRVALFANDAALDLVHLPASQVIGRRAASILQDYDTTQLLARAARLNQTCERTFQRVTTGQTWRVIATPLQRRVAGASAVPDATTDLALTIEDLTELRRLETVRRDFVAHVSHELRTPLAAVKLLAETLVNALDRDPVAARGFAQRISGEADHLSQMVAELLELSRIESGKIEPRLEPTDLAALVEAAIERMRPLAIERGVTLEEDAPKGLPDALCDGERVGEALVNLIHNGLKYTDPGGWVRVSIALIEEEASVTSSGSGQHERVMRPVLATTVSDNGAGISEGDLPRVFERFFKADRARTRQPSGPLAQLPSSVNGQVNGAANGQAITAPKRSGGLQALAAGGTGLGLAITRHLIELHGGRIWAESKLGHGSRFTFTLPLAGK
ncbi:MAG TPA: ATP-binding protein [Ktedonobacterales bacterium]|nr:ATP-binding protein [Ktedonobacterales bacterium]